MSLRYFEAIADGKKLISNNPEVKHMRFYDPRQVLLIRSPEDISREFLDAEFTPYPYTDEFSPIRWIDRIEREL